MSTRGLLRRATTVWRRSIQARVVISTLVLSAVVVSLVGWFLLRQITEGLVDSKTSASVAEATRGAAEAQDRLSGTSGTDPDAAAQLSQLATTIVSRGDVQGFDVVLAGPVAGTTDGLVAGSGTRKSPGVVAASVPEPLREAVEQRAGTSWTYTAIRYERDTGQPTVPGIVTGSQITSPWCGRRCSPPVPCSWH